MTRSLPPSDHYAPAERTKDQVSKFLAECAKNGSDKAAAKLLLNHGRMTPDARTFVAAWR